MSDDWFEQFNDNVAAAADACPDEMDALTAANADLAAASVAADVARDAFHEAHVDAFGAMSPHAEWYDHLLGALPIPSVSELEAGGLVIGGCGLGGGPGCVGGVIAGGAVLIKDSQAKLDKLKETEAALKAAEAALRAAEIKAAIAQRRALECVWHQMMKSP